MHLSPYPCFFYLFYAILYLIMKEGAFMSIRPANPGDLSRIAEIVVFNNRLNFFPIFGDPGYSFGEMQVLPLAESWGSEPDFFSTTYVYEDDVHGIVLGFIRVHGDELVKLYVEPCYQSKGIGAQLLTYAAENCKCSHLWALEKNTRALDFYRRHGFLPTGEKIFEEGTTEYLVHLARQ